MAALVGLLLYQPSQQPQTFTVTQGFEDGLGDWATGADVPENPNSPGQDVNWTINIVSNNSYSGNHSAQFYLDGRQDDGTIWLTRNLTLTPDTTKNVTVTFQLWSNSESFNTLANVVGYVGLNSTKAEADFQTVSGANQVEGWKSYSYSKQVTTDATGKVCVSLGISAVWETEMTYYIDDVTVTAS